MIKQIQKNRENPLPKDWGKFNFEVEENISEWEERFDKEFVLTEYDYKLMETRGVLGGIKQIKAIKVFIKKEKEKSKLEGIDMAIGEEKEQSRINVKRVRDDVNSWVGGYNKKRSEIIKMKN